MESSNYVIVGRFVCFGRERWRRKNVCFDVPLFLLAGAAAGRNRKKDRGRFRFRMLQTGNRGRALLETACRALLLLLSRMGGHRGGSSNGWTGTGSEICGTAILKINAQISICFTDNEVTEAECCISGRPKFKACNLNIWQSWKQDLSLGVLRDITLLRKVWRSLMCKSLQRLICHIFLRNRVVYRAYPAILREL